MGVRVGRSLFVLLALLVVAAMAVPALVTGSTSATSERNAVVTAEQNVTVRDLDEDGDPDFVKILRDITGDGSEDAIVIVDRQDNLKRLQDWRRATEYDGVELLYDVDNDGTVQTAVVFERTEGRWSHRAKVVDTHHDDIKYRVDGETVSVTNLHGAPPVVVMKSRGPWTRQDHVSYRLQLTCTRHVRCSFDDPNYHRQGNVTVNVVDENGDGIPEHEVRRVMTDSRHSPGRSILKTHMMVNEGSEPTLSPDVGTFWPYLGTAKGRTFAKPSGVAHPPVQVNWTRGRVSTLGEFVSSRGDENNYFVYSLRELRSTGVNPPSFETPFGFYDLANDDDGMPELAIRMVSYEQGSNFGLGLFPRKLPFTITQSRYSWDQNNDGQWDYKIGVVGRHAYSNVVEVGDYRIRHPEYENLPNWVLSRQWKTTVFVHAPSGFKGSEGIYEGGFDAHNRRTVFGLDGRDSQLSNSIDPGFRLERGSQYETKPQIYFSPIDNAVHLYGLDEGVWNRSSAAPKMHYQNVDSDPFVDVWRTRNGSTEEVLIAENGTLVYSGSEGVLYKHTAVTHSAFVTQPPKTRAEWAELRSRLNRSEDSTVDLRRIFDRYDGRSKTLSNATVTDYVPTRDGFRLVVERSQGDGGNASTASQTPRVLRFSDENESVRNLRATPPELSVSNLSVSSGESFERNVITVTVRNDGLQTAENVVVSLKDGEKTITNATVELVGKRTQQVKLQWWPGRDSDELKVTVRGPNPTGERAETSHAIEADQLSSVERGHVPSLLERYQVSNSNTYASLSFGAVVLVGTILITRRVLS